ncbi:MAG: tyrosine-type recombinase/integrase [Nevskiales bacterium]
MNKLADVQIRQWIKSGERFDGRGDGSGLWLCYRKDYALPIWRFRYRFAGKPRVMNLGSYRALSLADARKTAKELRARVALGYDVAAEKQERKREAVAKIEAAKNARTMAQLADEYFERTILGRWKYPNIVRSRIERDIKPAIGNLAVTDVKPRHVDDLLKAVVARGAPTIANDVLRWLRRMFDYGIKRQYLGVNPASAFDLSDAGGKEESRKRWLTRDELVKFFAAMRAAKGFTRENELTVKLLLLLAVRTSELREAPWKEFDLECAVWHLPENRTKTGAAIDIPLPKLTLEWLRELQRLGCGSDFVLPARKMQSRMLPYIHEGTIGTALGKVKHGLEPFTVHDFRRTARTHLEALGVAPHIAERCLNHKLKGVEGIYNRHDYLEERREALERWAKVLRDCELGKGGKVTPLRQTG